MLKAWNLQPCGILVLACKCKILNDLFGLVGKGLVDAQCPFSIGPRHFEIMF